jgi:molecular chaperone DnaJ
MRGKGFPKVRGSSRGDQLVKIQIITPRSLSKNQKNIIKSLMESSENSGPKFKRTMLD